MYEKCLNHIFCDISLFLTEKAQILHYGRLKSACIRQEKILKRGLFMKVRVFCEENGL